jgi:LysM repeat protein/tRNA-binding EMAP/Myf-like protein
MASSIGIKIANGEFYPIMEENSLIRKRLILTTVHDSQPSVQIDLFRSANNTMTDAQYIGSLVVESINLKPRGEPSIEMVISSNNGGEIVADAIDLDTGSSGEHHVLTVSLQSLDETSREMEIPDFELEVNEEPPSGLYSRASDVRRQKSRSSLMWIFIIIGLVIILGIVALWLFLFGGLGALTSGRDRPAVTQVQPVQPARQPEPVQQQPEPVREPEPVMQPEPVQQQPEPVREPEPVQQQEEPVPVIQASAVPPPAPAPQPARRRPVPPVASYKVPATIPRDGVNYTIRYGDTLWDIAEAFYRNPWLYTRIARYNNIRNPNYIISGRTIRIPPRN